jgi:hypothetical protein
MEPMEPWKVFHKSQAYQQRKITVRIRVLKGEKGEVLLSFFPPS